MLVGICGHNKTSLNHVMRALGFGGISDGGRAGIFFGLVVIIFLAYKFLTLHHCPGSDKSGALHVPCVPLCAPEDSYYGRTSTDYYVLPTTEVRCA